MCLGLHNRREKNLTRHRVHLCHRGVFRYTIVSKLFLVDGQQVSDPVIQPHTQNELMGGEKASKN